MTCSNATPTHEDSPTAKDDVTSGEPLTSRLNSPTFTAIDEPGLALMDWVVRLSADHHLIETGSRACVPDFIHSQTTLRHESEPSQNGHDCLHESGRWSANRTGTINISTTTSPPSHTRYCKQYLMHNPAFASEPMMSNNSF